MTARSPPRGSASAMLSATLRQGSRLGSWNTQAVRGLPPGHVIPVPGIKPSISFSNVVLPQPDGPNRATTSPGARSNAIGPSSGCTAPARLESGRA